MIFCAVTGPTPGRASSCSMVAELRSTGAVGEGPAAAPATPGPRAGTSTCSPSASGAARLTSSSCARAVAPPARAAVQVRAHALGRRRERHELLLGEACGHLHAVADLAVHLADEHDRLPLELRLVRVRPGLGPQP